MKTIDEEIDSYIEQHKTTACQLYPHDEVITIRKVRAILNRVKNAHTTLDHFEDMRLSYENTCNQYLQAFCQKHNYEYLGSEAWVAYRAGEVACIGDLFVDFRNIKTDIDMNANKEDFLQWYDTYIEEKGDSISYETFLKTKNHVHP